MDNAGVHCRGFDGGTSMSEIENPRAFPSTAIDDKCGGMLLRDYFAGQALAGIAASCGEGESINPAMTAQFVYKVADAMLAERAKAQGTPS